MERGDARSGSGSKDLKFLYASKEVAFAAERGKGAEGMTPTEFFEGPKKLPDRDLPMQLSWELEAWYGASLPGCSSSGCSAARSQY